MKHLCLIYLQIDVFFSWKKLKKKKKELEIIQSEALDEIEQENQYLNFSDENGDDQVTNEVDFIDDK